MSEHASFVFLAYATCFVTIGGVALRIVLDYRRLRGELARFREGASSETGDDA
jgi:heme exporter protein D